MVFLVSPVCTIFGVGVMKNKQILRGQIAAKLIFTGIQFLQRRTFQQKMVRSGNLVYRKATGKRMSDFGRVIMMLTCAWFCGSVPLFPPSTLVITLTFQFETFFATFYTLQQDNTLSRLGRASRKKSRKFDSGTLVADTNTSFGWSTFSSFSVPYLYEISLIFRPFTRYTS
jgi:hypothetical protein